MHFPQSIVSSKSQKEAKGKREKFTSDTMWISYRSGVFILSSIKCSKCILFLRISVLSIKTYFQSIWYDGQDGPRSEG